MHDHHSKLLQWKLPSLSWLSAFTHIRPITQCAVPHSSHIPQELIDHIIDILGASNDHSTLKVCATTSRAFLSRSRYHLFRTIDLKKRILEHDGGLGLGKLYQFLRSNRSLCKYIREVRVPIVCGDRHWRKKERTIAAILNALPATQSFTLYSYYVNHTDWRTFTPKFETAVLKIISSSTLKHLHLSAIGNIPLAHISRSCNLVSLRLVDTKPDTSKCSSSSIINSKLPRPCPQELVFDCSSATIRTIIQDGASTSLVDFSRLQSLRVYPQSPDDVSIAWDVAQIAGPSLRSLEFDLSHRAIYPLPSPPDLTAMPNLQHLFLLALFEDNDESLGGALKMLNSIINDNAIEEIIIKILVGFGVKEDDPCICADIPWASLDTLFTHQKFKRLHRLGLELHYCDYDVDYEDNDSGKQINEALAYEIQDMTTSFMPNLLFGNTPFEVQFAVHVHHDLSFWMKQRCLVIV